MEMDFIEESKQPSGNDDSWHDLSKFAKQLITAGDYQSAMTLYKQAISMCPEENESLYVQFGHLLMLMKDTEQAKEILLKAVHIKNKTGGTGSYNKFFELAQLMEGQEALELYYDGIYSLKSEIEKYESVNILNENEDIQRLQQDLCDAYGAISELFMSDLSGEKDAQAKCWEFIQKGLEINPRTVDCNLQLANYYLRLGDDQQTIKSMQIVVEEIVKSENESNLGCDQDIEFLIKVAQILIEIKQFEWAVSILKIIVDKDKDDIEGLYLMAFSQFQIGNFDNTHEFLEELSKHDLSTDQEIQSAVEELKEELQNKLESNKKDENEEMKDGNDGDEDDDDDENEWMDIE